MEIDINDLWEATLGPSTVPDETPTGLHQPVNAIDGGLSDRADYSQVVKVYATAEDGREARYSPGEVTQVVKTPILGAPDMARSCTAHVERQNGSLRQWCKRLTQLTYAFSKSGKPFNQHSRFILRSTTSAEFTAS